VFKTLPTGTEVSALALGGDASGKDKVSVGSRGLRPGHVQVTGCWVSIPGVCGERPANSRHDAQRQRILQSHYQLDGGHPEHVRGGHKDLDKCVSVCVRLFLWTRRVETPCVVGVGTAGELIYNLFDHGKDVGFYMAPDVIYSFCVRRITRWGFACLLWSLRGCVS
jgi:hypothetical protein